MARKTLKKIQVQAMSSLLDSYVDLKLSPAFAFAVVKNRAALIPEVAKLREIVKPFGDYDSERVALCEEYAEKDESGKPVLKDNTYKGVEGNPEFLEKVKALEEGYQERFKEANQALREQTVEVELVEIPLGELPNGITPTVLEILMPMIRVPA